MTRIPCHPFWSSLMTLFAATSASAFNLENDGAIIYESEQAYYDHSICLSQPSSLDRDLTGDYQSFGGTGPDALKFTVHIRYKNGDPRMLVLSATVTPEMTISPPFELIACTVHHSGQKDTLIERPKPAFIETEDMRKIQVWKAYTLLPWNEVRGQSLTELHFDPHAAAAARIATASLMLCHESLADCDSPSGAPHPVIQLGRLDLGTVLDQLFFSQAHEFPLVPAVTK